MGSDPQAHLLIGLLILLVLGGVAISQLELIPLDRAIYFAFTTGLSIGYGDIVSKTGWGCVVSVLIGMVGMIFIGMSVAVATRALADTTKEQLRHTDRFLEACAQGTAASRMWTRMVNSYGTPVQNEPPPSHIARAGVDVP